jgi:hypothetical protein
MAWSRAQVRGSIFQAVLIPRKRHENFVRTGIIHMKPDGCPLKPNSRKLKGEIMNSEIELNWGAEPERAPDVAEGETILFSECGRVLNNIDYRSHYFRLIKGEYGDVVLLVKHGGGQERIREHLLRKIVKTLELLDSDNRYMTLYAVFQAYREGKKHGEEVTAMKYREAFVSGRLKKRKVRNSSSVKVWIKARPII